MISCVSDRRATMLHHRTLLGGSSPPMPLYYHGGTITLYREVRAKNGSRTHNLLITSQVLYQLSYPGLAIWSSIALLHIRKG